MHLQKYKNEKDPLIEDKLKKLAEQIEELNEKIISIINKFSKFWFDDLRNPNSGRIKPKEFHKKILDFINDISTIEDLAKKNKIPKDLYQKFSCYIQLNNIENVLKKIPNDYLTNGKGDDKELQESETFLKELKEKLDNC